jgi:acyl-CoA synthetase (AMP-forming)/AMP-acid ligase II
MRGRLSERITVAGVHWYPRDTEEALLHHPAVREVAVVGVPDVELGQRPVAFVTARGAGLPVSEVVAAASSSVSDLDLSLLSLELVEEMPMTPTGKISKAQLLERHLRKDASR